MIGDLTIVLLTLFVIGYGIVSKKMKWWGAIGILPVLYNLYVDKGEKIIPGELWLGLLSWMTFWSAWQ